MDIDNHGHAGAAHTVLLKYCKVRRDDGIQMHTRDLTEIKQDMMQT